VDTSVLQVCLSHQSHSASCSSYWTVCGEDCTTQRCKECATSEQLTEVVDLILYRTLDDLDPSLGTIDELSITLACGHTFTVETLDGHCHIADYYEKDEASQRWTTPIAPPSDFMTPPACPTCRASINALRYGRVVKRANLDILETNVGSRMVRSLDRVHDLLGQFDRPTLQARLKAYGSQTNEKEQVVSVTQEVLFKRQRQKDVVLSRNHAGPVPASVLDPGNPQLHGAPMSDSKEWREATALLSRAYKHALDISSTRSSHIHAWEAAFTALFNTYFDAIIKEPPRAAGDPAEQALSIARLLVGQPRPIADSKYRIKAICATIVVRFTMVDLAEALLEALGTRSSAVEQSRIWTDYAEFVLRTCVHDAEKAIETSRQSESHRQASEIVPIVMQAQLKLFHISVIRVRSQGQMTERRQELVGIVAQRQQHARQYLADAIGNHMAARRQAGEAEWIKEKLLQPGEEILEEWEKVERSLKMDTFYSPVTREDQISIVKAFGFGGSLVPPRTPPAVLTCCQEQSATFTAVPTATRTSLPRYAAAMRNPASH
jgi:hypothetical protein